MRFLRTIDESGIHAFKEIREQLNHNNTQLLLSSVNPYMQQLLENTRIVEKMGKENILSDINNALIHAKEILKIN